MTAQAEAAAAAPEGPGRPRPATVPTPATASASGTGTDTSTGTGTGTEPSTGTGRDAILRAAQRAFALRPYAEVTLRGIAADAGVSASLIVKRFGGKEQLFAAVADFGPAADALFTAPLPELGRHMVRTLVGQRRAQQGDPLLRVVFSLGISDERSLLRDRFQEQITDRLATLLTGPDATLRAELIAAQLIGLGATLSIHRTGATSQAPPERLADLYAPALQQLIEG